MIVATIEPAMNAMVHRRCNSEENLLMKKRARCSQLRRHSESDAQPMKKRKRVRILLEPQQMLQPLAPKACWYSKEDLVTSKKIARKLSRNANSDSVLQETYDKACKLSSHEDEKTSEEIMAMLEGSGAFWKQRGLERLSQRHAISRSMQVCQVKSAVLLEQTSQYLDGIMDPERLASASIVASRPSQHFAQMLALADQAMAKRIYSEPAELPQRHTPVAPTA